MVRANGNLVLDRVLAGDCLDVLARGPAGFAHLVYLDPPFNTGRPRKGAPRKGRSRERAAAYPDRWPDLTAYLDFMRPRLAMARRALRPDGSLLLHCDWRSCHHLRLVLDELFGARGFVNHLVWAYGLGGSSPRRFARKHDDILFYAAGPDYFFEPPLVPATSNRMRGLFKKSTDVLHVPAINNQAAERVGYPTQKPLALLELLVGACCPPGGIVADPFCGSGTALVAARRSGRRYLGIDASPDAVRIAEARLAETDARRRPTMTSGRCTERSAPRLRSQEKTATSSQVKGNGATPSTASKQNHVTPGGRSPADLGRGMRSIGLP